MELLKNLYEISSPSNKEDAMRIFLTTYCRSLGCKVKVDKTGNIYAKKGKSKTYPCVVAHIDEVCPERPMGYKVLETNGRLFGFDTIKCEQCGIGGDDKNGIWIALKCLRKYDAIKCAFFVAEEVGCIGSSDANMEWFENCRFVVQCDRRGNSDLVTYISGELCSKEFIDAVNPTAYGYKESTGLMTDVLSLKENGLNVSCVNMSCGYYNPHTEREYTIIDDLYKCLDFVEHIIEDCTDVYPHTYRVVSRWQEFNDYPKYNHLGSCKKNKKGQLDLLYNELLEFDMIDDTTTAEELLDWYGYEYPSLTLKDYKDLLATILADKEEEMDSLRNDLQSRLTNNPFVELDDIVDEVSADYTLSYADIRSVYEEFMS